MSELWRKMVMRENDKDWSNPAFTEIYIALAALDLITPNNSVLDWLNHNGFCNLTCCPVCHIDDFYHVEGKCEVVTRAVQLAARWRKV